MRHLRFVVRRPLRLLLAMCLGLTGCSDEPNLPANVEEAARRREQEEQRVDEELERERQRIQEAVKRDAGSTETPDAIPAAQNDSTDNDSAAPADDNTIPSASTEVSDSPPPTPTPPVVPRNRTTMLKWSQMKAGMTPAEVRKLLGPPTRQSQDFFLTYWYYGTGQRAGKIAFISQSQRTMAWDLPLE